jgi:hypothetical protein
LREENTRRNAQLEERFTALELQQQQTAEAPEPTPSANKLCVCVCTCVKQKYSDVANNNSHNVTNAIAVNTIILKVTA